MLDSPLGVPRDHFFLGKRLRAMGSFLIGPVLAGPSVTPIATPKIYVFFSSSGRRKLFCSSNEAEYLILYTSVIHC